MTEPFIRPCPRCGVERQVNESRPVQICTDCKSVLSAADRVAWAA